MTDVKGANCAPNMMTTVFYGRTRFKGLWYSTSAPTKIVIKDGSVTLFTFVITTPSSDNIVIPGDGALCSSGLIVILDKHVFAVAFHG